MTIYKASIYLDRGLFLRVPRLTYSESGKRGESSTLGIMRKGRDLIFDL